MEGWVTFVSAAAVVTHAVRLPPVMKEILWFLGLGGRGRDRPGYEGKPRTLWRDIWDQERSERLGWWWRLK